MTWIVPPGPLFDPRVYAWVDPQNLLTEVHEENNIGWIPLGLNFPVGIEESPVQYGTFVLYPNPAQDLATVNVELSRTAKMKIQVYDLAGGLAKDYGEKHFPQGEHYIPIEIGDLAQGMYICRVLMPEGNLQQKLVVYRP